MNKQGIVFNIREFLKFIRAESCLYVSSMGASGYLFFNPASYTLLFLFLAVFFATAASYAYNHLTDKEEDTINDKRLNIFVTSGMGMPVTIGMVAAGIACALFLPAFSLFLYILGIPAILAYSAFRVKEIFLVKNAYTGLMMGFAFIIGASIKGIITSDMLYIFFAAFFIGSIGNMIGDIRGYKGDLVSGVKTLPVKIGTDSAKKFVHFMFLGFAIYILVFRYNLFYPFVPFMFLISFFLAMEKQRAARYSIVFSFITFSLYLLIKAAEGGM